MRKNTEYTDEPLKLKVVKDFLPSPDELMLRRPNVSVKLELRKSSLEYYKSLAKKHKTTYKKVIKKVLDTYAREAV